jgi:hypothetical protein
MLSQNGSGDKQKNHLHHEPNPSHPFAVCGLSTVLTELPGLCTHIGKIHSENKQQIIPLSQYIIMLCTAKEIMPLKYTLYNHPVTSQYTQHSDGKLCNSYILTEFKQQMQEVAI